MMGKGAGSRLERRSRLPDEYRDSMLELVASGGDVDVLGARLFELRCGQVHVFAGSHSTLKAAFA